MALRMLGDGRARPTSLAASAAHPRRHFTQRTRQQPWRDEAAPGRCCSQQRPCSASAVWRQVGTAGNMLCSLKGMREQRRRCSPNGPAHRLSVDRVAWAAAASSTCRQGRAGVWSPQQRCGPARTRAERPGGWLRQAATVDAAAGARAAEQRLVLRAAGSSCPYSLLLCSIQPISPLRRACGCTSSAKGSGRKASFRRR